MTWLNFSSSQAVLIFETVAAQFSNPDEWVKSFISQIRCCCSFDHVNVCVCVCVACLSRCYRASPVHESRASALVKSWIWSAAANNEPIRRLSCRSRRWTSTLSFTGLWCMFYKPLSFKLRRSFMFCRTSWNLYKRIDFDKSALVRIKPFSFFIYTRKILTSIIFPCWYFKIQHPQNITESIRSIGKADVCFPPKSCNFLVCLFVNKQTNFLEDDVIQEVALISLKIFSTRTG